MSTTYPDQRFAGLSLANDLLRWSVAAILADASDQERRAILTRWRDAAHVELGRADPADWSRVTGLRLLHRMAGRGLELEQGEASR